MNETSGNRDKLNGHSPFPKHHLQNPWLSPTSLIFNAQAAAGNIPTRKFTPSAQIANLLF